MVNAHHTFHIADYSVFAVTIIVSLGIGLYYALSGGKQRTTSEYLVGNRQMMIIPVAISLMVSFESSIMMLGTPAEVNTMKCTLGDTFSRTPSLTYKIHGFKDSTSLPGGLVPST